MAASRSFTPQRSSASRPVRRFTLEQANAALPLVRRIVADIVQAHTQVAGHRAALEQASSSKDVSAVEKELEIAGARLERLVEELTGVGVELKDSEVGLVDFVGQHDDHDVYLCWKLGEEQITHWHERNAGFSGRKPISALREPGKQSA